MRSDKKTSLANSLKSIGFDNDKMAIFLYGCIQGVKFVKRKPVVFNLVK